LNPSYNRRPAAVTEAHMRIRGDGRCGVFVSAHNVHSHSASTLASRSPLQCVAFSVWAKSIFASLRTAHTAMPRTSGAASPSSGITPGISPASPELPAATSTLRIKRTRPVRLTGEPLKRARKVASSRVSNSASAGLAAPGRGANLASRAACANLFQGQTPRQSSQPWMRLPRRARNSRGICSLCSMVR